MRVNLQISFLGFALVAGKPARVSQVAISSGAPVALLGISTPHVCGSSQIRAMGT